MPFQIYFAPGRWREFIDADWEHCSIALACQPKIGPTNPLILIPIGSEVNV